MVENSEEIFIEKDTEDLFVERDTEEIFIEKDTEKIYAEKDTNELNGVLYEVNLVERLVSETIDRVLARFVIRDKTINRNKLIDLVVQNLKPRYYKGTSNEIDCELTKFRTNTKIDVIREIIKVIININCNVNQ